MTNIFNKPEKLERKKELFGLAKKALEQAGWRVEKTPGSGKSSLLRLTKGDKQYTASVRTTQDQRIAFPRKKDDSGWLTLDEADYVVAATVDDKNNPQEGRVYMLDGDDVRERFDRAYQKRREAGYSLPIGRGVWVSLFTPENSKEIMSIGGGIALGKTPLLCAKLETKAPSHPIFPLSETAEKQVSPPVNPAQRQDVPLSIAEAKRQLAQSLGIDPDKVKIIIEA